LPMTASDGGEIVTGRSWHRGSTRSRHSFIANMSPASAASTALPVSLRASPSSRVTAASVAFFREPGRRPAGSPDCPGWNIPCVRALAAAQSLRSSHCFRVFAYTEYGIASIAIARCRAGGRGRRGQDRPRRTRHAASGLHGGNRERDLCAEPGCSAAVLHNRRLAFHFLSSSTSRRTPSRPGIRGVRSVRPRRRRARVKDGPRRLPDHPFLLVSEDFGCTVNEWAAVRSSRPSPDLSPCPPEVHPDGERGTGPVPSFNPNSCMGAGARSGVAAAMTPRETADRRCRDRRQRPYRPFPPSLQNGKCSRRVRALG
jgi:hypothetical protein